MIEIPEEILYDNRLVERHIRQGHLTREQADKYLAQAQDMTEQADFLDLEVLQYGARRQEQEDAP